MMIGVTTSKAFSSMHSTFNGSARCGHLFPSLSFNLQNL